VVGASVVVGWVVGGCIASYDRVGRGPLSDRSLVFNTTRKALRSIRKTPDFSGIAWSVVTSIDQEISLGAFSKTEKGGPFRQLFNTSTIECIVGLASMM
jgi:hypothetical protein